ncbi:MAG: hypothetical protein HC919_00635 [Oscillatoriales cyanobacterium SM2_2_1]|nr:hypothetical protein [Oscillatoriales cyanobacterium SM2_2_1]
MAQSLLGWLSLWVGRSPIYQKLRQHLTQIEGSFQPVDHFVELYHSATYIDGEREHHLKRHIHRGLQHYIAPMPQPRAGTPDPQRLAVVTKFWHPDDPIYCGFGRWVGALSRRYAVDLWHIGTPTAATDGFDRVTVLECHGGQMDLEALAGHGAMAVCFLEVGRSLESLWLANLRLAPIQMACLGHPVTTAGAELDYFISGAEVELGRGAEQFYSERLVLLPNAGLELSLSPAGDLPQSLPPDPLVILCPWELPTLNHPLLQLLHKILRESRVPLCFRLLVGASLNRYNDYLSCRQEVHRILGDHFELLPTKTYPEWRSLMTQGHLCLDAYPVGVPWAIATALSLGIPAITLEAGAGITGPVPGYCDTTNVQNW